MPAFDRDKVQEPTAGRPHLVLLGAGATLAACPRGDANGRRLPLMWNIVETLGLVPLLERSGVDGPYDDFETLYSRLTLAGTHSELLKEIDFAVFKYFEELTLPVEPTLYDHLVLSLRDKDVIATFNWDPFLVQALHRKRRDVRGPSVLFLHGNVAVGYCPDHLPLMRLGDRGQRCPGCGKVFIDTRLLFPVVQKNYNSDPFGAKAWEVVQKVLGDAYIFTIFGYSAPASDVEARRLLESAWGGFEDRQFEQVEIIDIKPKRRLRESWSPFVHTHHYDAIKSFYSSIIARFPRRSCEALWAQTMEVRWLTPNNLPRRAGWTHLHKFIDALVDDEIAHGA